MPLFNQQVIPPMWILSPWQIFLCFSLQKISKQFWTAVPRRWITWSEAIDPRYIHLCLPLLKAFCYFVEPPSFPLDALKYPHSWQAYVLHLTKAQWLSPPISLNLSDFRDIIKPGILSSVPTHAKQHFFSQQGGLFWPGCFKTHGGRHGGIPPSVSRISSQEWVRTFLSLLSQT